MPLKARYRSATAIWQEASFSGHAMQEQQRQESLRKIERTERSLQMLDGCFGSFVLMVGVPVALTIFAIWFVISHF